MTDMIAQQTRLRVIDNNNADLRMEGEITNYQLSPQAVGEDAYASQTRLTITVRVKYTNNKNQALSKDLSFSAYRDFSSSELLVDVQDELCNQISKDLADLIFNATLGDWFQIKNVFGKEDTLITIQIDQFLAEKFGMEYTDRDGVKKRPYIIHRTSIGCYERTLALLIEKYAGAFPLWLAPEQIRLLPIADRHQPYAVEVEKRLSAQGFRVTTDMRSEKISYKIREAQLQKVPYMLIIGDKEKEAGTVFDQTPGSTWMICLKLMRFSQEPPRITRCFSAVSWIRLLRTVSSRTTRSRKS